MTNKLHYLLAFMLMATFTTSCTKQVQNGEALAGTWEWKSTDGGLGFHLHLTPASTGQREQLKLTGNLRYFLYINNVMKEEGSYALWDQPCIHDKKKKTVIRFSGALQDRMVEKVDREQLVLSDEHYDGFEFMYERKNEQDN